MESAAATFSCRVCVGQKTRVFLRQAEQILVNFHGMTNQMPPRSPCITS